MINDLNINLGTADISRFQCANHKLDLVARKSIKLHPDFSAIAIELNKSSSHCKRVVKLSRVFR